MPRYGSRHSLFVLLDDQNFRQYQRDITHLKEYGLLIDLAVVPVTQGEEYRLRAVGMTTEASLIFSIDNHTFTVIGVDGVNNEPIVVDSLQVFAGEH